MIQEIKKRPRLKKWVASIIYIINKSYMFLINKFYGVKNKKVVFISFSGKSYSDNPRAISEKLHELYPEFEIVWLFNNPNEKVKTVPNYVRCVKYGSLEALKELATAKFWVDNFTKPIYTYKSRKQIYIQTWHGDRGFKKVLYDARTKLPNGHYIEGDLIEPKICSLAISGSDYGDRVYRTAFGYNGQILKVGSPRADQLIQNDSNKIINIKKTLNISKETKVLLYAPTFRDSKKDKIQDINAINLQSIISCLENKTLDKWICLIRAHAASAGFNNVKGIDYKIKNVTDYEDMADLLLITDFLITDYSSSVGDFILLKRPYIMYQSDRDDYISNDREFYFDFDDSPYYIAFNNEDLILKINSMDKDIAEKNANNLLEFYKTVETGQASKKVVEYMINKMN